MINADTLPLWLVGAGSLVLILLSIGAVLLISSTLRWRPAGGLVMIAMTPLYPHVPVAMGFSYDDIPPLVGVAALAWAAWKAGDSRRVIDDVLAKPLLRWLGIVIGASIALLVLTSAASSVANTPNVVEFAKLFARDGVRFLLMAAIVVFAVLADPPARRTQVVNIALVLVGIFEAAFGIFAYLVPLPYNFGLELTRKASVLHSNVRGRVSGTTGISPDFLGAVFLFTIPLNVALALDARTRRTRAIWWVAAGAQMLALGLTFTRASLGLAIVEVGVLLLLRAKLKYLIPLAAALVPVAIFTPAMARLVQDMPDRLALWTSGLLMMFDHPLFGVGSGRMVAEQHAYPDRYLHTAFGPAQVSAHNTVILAGAEMGVVAFVAALALNIAIAVLAVRMLLCYRRSKASLAPAAAALGVLSYLIQGMVNDLFTVAVVATLATLVLGAHLIVDDPDTLVADPGSAAWDLSLDGRLLRPARAIAGRLGWWGPRAEKAPAPATSVPAGATVRPRPTRRK